MFPMRSALWYHQADKIVQCEEVKEGVNIKIGSAYRIRTGDLLLEREACQNQPTISYVSFSGPSFGFNLLSLQGCYHRVGQCRYHC